MKKLFEILIILILLVVLVYVARQKLGVLFYNQGRAYYDRGLYDNAILSFKKSLKINPNVAIVHCSMADAYMEKRWKMRQ